MNATADRRGPSRICELGLTGTSATADRRGAFDGEFPPGTHLGAYTDRRCASAADFGEVGLIGTSARPEFAAHSGAYLQGLCRGGQNYPSLANFRTDAIGETRHALQDEDVNNDRIFLARLRSPRRERRHVSPLRPVFGEKGKEANDLSF